MSRSLRVECQFRVEYCYFVLRWSGVHVRIRRTCQILGRPVSHLQCLGQFRMEDHTVSEALAACSESFESFQVCDENYGRSENVGMEKTSVSSEIVHVSVRKGHDFYPRGRNGVVQKTCQAHDQEETFEKDQEKEQVDHKNLVVRISFGGVVRSVRPVSSNVYEILNSRFALEHRYSGLLECPMTTRLERVVDTSYFLSDFVCHQNETIETLEQCVNAVDDILQNQHVVLSSNRTVNSTTLPRGCSARMSNGSVDVFLNEMEDSLVTCRDDDDAQVLGETSALGLNLSVRVGLETTMISLSGPADVWFGIGFDAQNMGDLPYTIVRFV